MVTQLPFLGQVDSIVGDAWLVNLQGIVKLQPNTMIASNDLIVTSDHTQGLVKLLNGGSLPLQPNGKQLIQSDDETASPESVIQSLDLSEMLPPAAAGEVSASGGGSIVITKVVSNAAIGSVTSGYSTSTLNISEGSLASNDEEQQVVIREEAPTISGFTEAAVQEDMRLEASGQLIAKDANIGDIPSFDIQTNVTGNYGTFSIDVNGLWTYQLDNNAAQGLSGTDSLQESFPVTARTPDGETVSETVVVTIAGSEDEPTISGSTQGAVQEDVTFQTTGQLSAQDIDTTDTPTFDSQTDIAGNYGTFSIDANGLWTYQLDNDAAQGLSGSDSLQESFPVTARTLDGETVSTTVVVNVSGKSDAPIAIDDRNSLNVDTQTSISANIIMPNDSDVDSDGLSVTNVGTIQGKYGTLNLSENGDYNYEISPIDLSDGLVSYWRFDETINNTVEDIANQGVKSDTINLKNGASIVDGVLQLDGNQSIAEIANSKDINLGKHEARTISLHFRADMPEGGRQVLYEEGAQVRGLTIYIESGELHILGWNTPQQEAGGWQGSHLSFELNDTNWHHIALTLDGNSGEFAAYLDGNTPQIAQGATALWQHSGDINFGATGGRTFFYDTQTQSIAVDSNNSKHAFFDGQIDEARIYDKVLNSAEVNVLANKGQNLVEEFEYQITDGELTDTANLTINLESNAPHPLEPQLTLEDNPLQLNLGSQNSYAVSSQHGTTILNTDGSVDYIPDLHFSGEDTLQYKLIDSFGNVETRTLSIDVVPTADMPILNTSTLIPTGNNLIINGSFEEDVGLTGKQWSTFDAGIEGWELTSGHSIEIQRNTITNASDGDQYVELDSYANSSMTQSLTLIPDHNYEIQFDYMPRPGVDEASNTVLVKWNGEVIDEITGHNESWTTHVYSVEGEQENGELTFEAVGKSDSLGGFIDNVMVTDLNSFSLNIEAMLVDKDGSEILALSMDNLPEDSKLSDSNNEFLGNGQDSIDLKSGWDLENLQLELPSDVDYQVSVTATAMEIVNGDIATNTQIIATNDGIAPLLSGNDDGNTIFHVNEYTLNDNSDELHIMNFHLEEGENDVIDLHEALNNFNSATDDINDYVTIELSSNGDGTTDSIINISTEGNGVVAESIVLENIDLSHQGTFADSNAMLSNMLTNQTLVVE